MTVGTCPAALPKEQFFRNTEGMFLVKPVTAGKSTTSLFKIFNHLKWFLVRREFHFTECASSSEIQTFGGITA